MKKTRAKKFKVRMFYHLQNLFWGVFVQGVFGLGVFVGGLCPGVFVWGVCPNTNFNISICFPLWENITILSKISYCIFKIHKSSVKLFCEK